MAVNGGKSNASIIHLASEDFISEEPVSKDAAVAIGAEKTLSSGDINKVAKESVHRIVLLFAVIDVFGVFIDLIASKHSL